MNSEIGDEVEESWYSFGEDQSRPSNMNITASCNCRNFVGRFVAYLHCLRMTLTVAASKPCCPRATTSLQVLSSPGWHGQNKKPGTWPSCSLVPQCR